MFRAVAHDDTLRHAQLSEVGLLELIQVKAPGLAGDPMKALRPLLQEHQGPMGFITQGSRPASQAFDN